MGGQQISAALVAAFSLASCASHSSSIEARYVSPSTYDSWSCNKLQEEQKRLASEVHRVAGDQDANADADVGIAIVGAVLFWPALFAMAATEDHEDELAQLKGQYDAVSQSVTARCAMAATPPTVTPAANGAVTPAPQQPVIVAPVATTQAVAPAASQWHGQGERDGCGLPYSVDVALDDNRQVRGHLQRGSADYTVNGKADPAGKLENSLAALTDPASSGNATQYLNLKMDFSGPLATGSYSTFDGSKFDCTTIVTLQHLTT